MSFDEYYYHLCVLGSVPQIISLLLLGALGVRPKQTLLSVKSARCVSTHMCTIFMDLFLYFFFFFANFV